MALPLFCLAPPVSSPCLLASLPFFFPGSSLSSEVPNHFLAVGHLLFITPITSVHFTQCTDIPQHGNSLLCPCCFDSTGVDILHFSFKALVLLKIRQANQKKKKKELPGHS